MHNTLTYQGIPADSSTPVLPPQLVQPQLLSQKVDGSCQALHLKGLVDLGNDAKVSDFHHWLVRNQYCLPERTPPGQCSSYEALLLERNWVQINAILCSIQDYSRFALLVITKVAPDIG